MYELYQGLTFRYYDDPNESYNSVFILVKHEHDIVFKYSYRFFNNNRTMLNFGCKSFLQTKFCDHLYALKLIRTLRSEKGPWCGSV